MKLFANRRATVLLSTVTAVFIGRPGLLSAQSSLDSRSVDENEFQCQKTGDQNMPVPLHRRSICLFNQGLKRSIGEMVAGRHFKLSFLAPERNRPRTPFLESRATTWQPQTVAKTPQSSNSAGSTTTAASLPRRLIDWLNPFR